ncbi:DUF4157 domain-containing protein [Methylobacter sp. Wu8]|uniref:eCIS core domain-containing protein n=1 Tax=Methylobacter sp. Wu8 TaxID=3118457 RepID=UPI002F326FCA
MQKKIVQTQAGRSNDTVSRQTSDSDRNGASAAPPAYGIDFLDHQKEQSNPTGLPDKLKVGIENLSGLSMNDVRVHYNSSKPAQLQALAYTQGTDIHVGPGQERHLPHETWHVVQQAQGRVQPTMQMKGEVPVNDDRSLEHEADVMGEKAVQMLGKMHDAKPDTVGSNAAHAENGGYRSPALQMRSNLSISSTTKPVIQLLKTWGGDWDTEKYEKIVPGVAGGARGAEIALKFTPGDNVDAELIGLTQTARAIKNNTAWYIGDATRASHGIDSANAQVINPLTKETDEGTHIDRIAPRNNPIYGSTSLAAGSTLKDTPMDNNATANPINLGVNATYQLGFHYTSAGALKHKDAKMYDKPVQPNVDKGSANIFEVTALGLKGTQIGTYFGSVKWGWKTDSAGKQDLIPLQVVSQGVPSSSFMKAASLWNAGKDSTGADTIDLPIVNVKITTAPITAQYPAGFIGPPLQIPAGTRVQIIRNATPPSTNGQIKVVDGVFTGNTLDVMPADMANLRDERP